jgi:hypothetical protein
MCLFGFGKGDKYLLPARRCDYLLQLQVSLPREYLKDGSALINRMKTSERERSVKLILALPRSF